MNGVGAVNQCTIAQSNAAPCANACATVRSAERGDEARAHGWLTMWRSGCLARRACAWLWAPWRAVRRSQPEPKPGATTDGAGWAGDHGGGKCHRDATHGAAAGGCACSEGDGRPRRDAMRTGGVGGASRGAHPSGRNSGEWVAVTAAAMRGAWGVVIGAQHACGEDRR